MADYMIKGETLTNIANAIRAKLGSSATMTPEQMSTEIENISVGGGDIDALIDGSIEGDITSNVSKLKSYAFYYCDKITSISLPNIINISSNAFSNCYGLKIVSVPNATNIYSGAFSNCRSLIKTIIGINNTNIINLSSATMFNFCYHIVGKADSIYNPNGDKDGFIYVPNTLVADYRTATNWSTYASQIMPWVATVEELANIDGTTYDYACVGEGLGSVEYHYNGTTWEVFR